MTNDSKNQIPAYKGVESYAFACYSHQDAESVYADLKEMDRHGINLWYDEGISAGSSWRAEIAAAISGAKQFIFFISDSSINSSHCLREVDYALSHDIEILPVYLEECCLPAELQLVLNRVQALFKKKDTRYMEHLLEALQEKRGLTALLPKPKKQTFTPRFMLIVLGLAVLLLVVWQRWDLTEPAEPTSPDTMASPASYDRYHEGLELMVRWDKDDNLDTAIGQFQKAIELDPDFALAYARLAGALRMKYSISREDVWLDDAIKNANIAASLNSDLAPVHVALGRIHTTQGNYDLAFAALKRALQIDPNDAEANQAMAKAYEQQGRLADAEASFKKAVALDQENLMVRDSYASFLYRQGQYDDAASQWQYIIDVAPDHFSVLVNLGSTLSEIGDAPQAITMYERAIDIRPTYMAYSNLGTAYSRGKRYPEAVDAYLKALKIDDSDSLAWGNLAYVYSWMNGMDSQAVETFKHAIELAEAARQIKPRDAYTHSDLALYYAKTGQTELALQRLETAITLAPDSGEIHAAAAEAYELMGQRDKAVELASKSLELGITMLYFQQGPDLADLLTDPRMQNKK
jgi:tetratricopeptide (TPR) repeat protein